MNNNLKDAAASARKALTILLDEAEASGYNKPVNSEVIAELELVTQYLEAEVSKV